MKVYTAEKPDGSVYVVVAGLDADRDGFARVVANYLRECPEDEATPQELSLYEWPDVETAGVWLEGKAPVAGASWPSMGRDARFGEIRYEYGGDGEGDWFYRAKASVS